MSMAAGDSDPEGVEVIMQTNMVNICELNARHETIWHLLARSRNAATSLEMAKVILSTSEHMSTSAYLDLQNIDGETAAQIAFQAGNWELVRLYLENGASPEGIELSSGSSSSNMKSLAARDAMGGLIERHLQAELKLRRMMPADPVRYITRDLSAGRERYPISVENCMGDGAELDADFEYSRVVLRRDDDAAFGGRVDFSLGCRCADECRTNCACNTSANCTPLYDGGGRLSEKACELARSNELGIVSECNSACWCGPGCASRVAQLGIRQRLQVTSL
ncbi:unnamed protein product, partial [Anisakis simplex]|uniref:Pre-SET domain-containing protein n=1 Tax=Anisakis simplex TaxID=6269 RepID=A0A0M3KHS5_ANISI